MIWQRQMKIGRVVRLLLTAMVLVAATATPALAAKDTTTETTVPAQLQGSMPAEGASAMSATCLGCVAGWGLWENGNTIRAKRASYTDETVTFIHVHWSFINPVPDSCVDMYDGVYVSASFKEKSNTSLDQIKDSNYSQGSQHHWANVGAHKWIDDGATWSVGYNGEHDICTDFGF